MHIVIETCVVASTNLEQRVLHDPYGKRLIEKLGS